MIKHPLCHKEKTRLYEIARKRPFSYNTLKEIYLSSFYGRSIEALDKACELAVLGQTMTPEFLRMMYERMTSEGK